MLQKLIEFIIPKQFRKKNILLLFLFVFINSIFFIGPIVIPFLTEWGHLNMTKIMTLQSIFLFSAAIFEIPTGALGDKFGRKFSVILGIISYLTGGAIYVATDSFATFMLAEAFMGLGVAFTSGSHEALEYDTLKSFKLEKEYITYIAKTRILRILGILIGGILVFLLPHIMSIRWVFASAFSTKFLALLVILFIPEPKHYKKDSLTPHYLEIIKQAFLFIKKSKVLFWIIITYVGFNLTSYFIFWLHQEALLQAGVSFRWFGIMEIFVALLGITYNILLPKLYKKFGYIKIGFLSTFLLLFLIITMLIVKSIPLLIAVTFILLHSISGELRFLPRAIMNKNIKSAIRATILSFTSLLLTLIRAIINPLVGIFSDINIWSTITITSIMGLFIVVVGMYNLAKRKLSDT